MKLQINNDKCENDKKTLLIVNDNDFVWSELCAVLETDYNIITAENSELAADLLHRRCADVSLVLLSGEVDKADELTVMSAVGRCSILKNIPVIVYLPETMRSAGNIYHLGIADYITVPLNAQTVRRRVNNTLLLYNNPSLFDATDAILQQEQSNREYYKTLSTDTLFEYSRKNDRLSIGRVGAQRLCISSIINKPKKSAEILSFGEDTMQNLFSLICAATPASPNVVYECSLKINGDDCPCILLIRVLWDGDEKQYSRLFGKLIYVGGASLANESPMQSERDALTGLYTRKSARKIIEKRLAIRKNESYMMILLDIDRLKNINDCYGSNVGDKVLIDFAGKLEMLLGADGVAARVGGDEFMVFMRTRNDFADEAAQVYDSLCSGFGIYAASASLGVSLCPDSGALYDELYHKADVALHFAKESQTPICFHTAKMPDFPHIHTPIGVLCEAGGRPNGVLPA